MHLKNQHYRLPGGGRIDREQPLRFSFNGRSMTGYAGDTLASALLANGVHLVGHTRLDGHDWFLVKDSNRSSRQGKHEGYYMYRDDYVQLKMLTFMVHRDVVEDILQRVGPQS